MAHTSCDNSNFILGFNVTSGNVHDSLAFQDGVENFTERYKDKILVTTVDERYITSYIAKIILEANILPSMPYKRPMTKEVFIKKFEFVYDEYNDFYICPYPKELKYSTTDLDGYKLYKSNPEE